MFSDSIAVPFSRHILIRSSSKSKLNLEKTILDRAVIFRVPLSNSDTLPDSVLLNTDQFCLSLAYQNIHYEVHNS